MIHFKRYSSLMIIIFVISAVLSCAKEAPTINLADTTSGSGGTEPGYFYPFVSAVYPSNGSTNIPLDTKYIIIFNMPIDTSTVSGNISATTTPLPSPPGVPSSQAFTISTVNNPIIELTFTGSLSGNNLISITIGSGILDQGGTIPLNNPGTWTFTTGSTPDTTNPTITLAPDSRTPPNGSNNVSVTAPGIQLEFSEAINPTTINSTTFYLERIDIGPTTIPTICNWSPAANPTIAMLTPIAPLEASTVLVTPQYRVTVTTGMTDLSGNPLSAGTTWTFTTESGDPDPGALTITSGPTVTYVDDTTAGISWTTNEATNFTLNYGQGDDLSAAPISNTVYTSAHYYLLGNPAGSPPSPALSPGSRYYFNINYEDYVGNSAGPTPVAPIEFNTETNEAPSAIDPSSENQTGLNWITRKADVANTGAFMVWRYLMPGSPSYYSIYGQRYNNSLTAQWNAGSPVAIFTEANQSYTFSSAVEDGTGGMIVAALRGNEVRTKRLDSAGAFVNWGAGTTTAAGTGLRIDSGGTNSYATSVPVYSGFITRPVPGGTTDMDIPSNPFYDFSTNFFSYPGLNNNDYVYDTVSHNVVTVTLSSNYRHVLGQSNPEIGANEAYRIYDQIASSTGVTAASHQINATSAPVIGTNYTGTYTCGTNTVYTQHGVTGVANNGDLVLNVTDSTYARVNAVPATIGPLGTIRTGNSAKATTGRLIDDIDLSIVAANDYVANNTTGAVPTTVSSNYGDYWELTLTNSSLAVVIGDRYYIYDGFNNFVAAGAATYSTTGTVEDNVNDLTSVAAGDNITIGSLTTIASWVSATQINLSNGSLSVAVGDDYVIYDGLNNYIDSGTATSDTTGTLEDTAANFLAGYAGYNIVIGSLTQVAASGVNNYDRLILTNGAFVFNLNDSYSIYDQYCSTHSTATNQFQSFNRIVFDWVGIDILSGETFNVYPNIVNGTSSVGTPITNPLYDNGVNLSAVANGNIVLNYSTGNLATVTNSTYDSSGALGLDSNIFSTGQQYEVIAFNGSLSLTASNIQHIGTAGAIAGTTLTVDSTASMLAGDIIYNLTDNDYAMITGVPTGTTITLSRVASFNNSSERYVIVRGTGVLNVWQNGNTIYGAIYPMGTNATSTPLRSTFTVNSEIDSGATSQIPFTVSDGKGNAYIIYRTTAGKLRIRLLNAAGNNVWSTNADVVGYSAIALADTQVGNTETILKVMSDNVGGVIILYQYNTGLMCVQRITDGGTAATRSWGASGYSVANTAAPDGGSIVDMVGDATNGVIVAAQIGNNIWANRITAAGGTPWLAANRDISTATGNQQNPKIFTDWTNARIVWEDDRFYSSTGYGIFGMQLIIAAPGTKSAAWRVNTNTADYNGASVMLNSGNKYWPLGIQIVTYNNGADGALIWEDWRNVNATLPYNGSDLLYIDIEAFVPY